MALDVLHLQYVISLSFTSITTFIVAIFVYFRNPRNILNRLFALYTLSIAIWSFGQAFLTLASASSRVETLFWGRLLHVGVVFIPTFFIHFVFTILRLKPNKKLLRFFYLLSFAFLFSIPSRFFIADAIPKLSFKFFITAGALYYLLVLFFAILVSYGLLKLYKGYKSSTGVKRNQLKYLFWPSVFGYLGGAPNLLLTIGYELYPLNPFGTYLVGIYILIISYAIIKYRLLDITVYATRAAIFVIISIAVMASAFGITSSTREFLIKIFENNWWYLPLFLCMLLASIGYAFAIFAIKKIEEKRSGKIRQTQESIEEAGRGMIEFGNIHRVAKVIPRFIIGLYKKNLGVEIEHVSVFIFDDKIGKFILEKSAGKKKLTEGKEVSSDHAINKWFTTKRRFLLREGHLQRRDIDVLRYEDIDYWMSNDKVINKDGTLPRLLEGIKNEMNSLEASICIPSIHDDVLIGFLLLGNKSQGMYTQEELDIFSRLSTNAAAAFRVAQLTTTLKNTQMGLIASGQLAAIGRLATSAKHEVNNPLQGIYGSVQHTLVYLKEAKDGYKLIKERIFGLKGKIEGAFSNLVKNEGALDTGRISEIRENLKILDRAFTLMDERGEYDAKFANSVDTNIKDIECFETKLKNYSESIPEEKTRDQVDEIALSLHTITVVLGKVRKLNQTVYDTIEKGRKDCERISEVIEIMYHLPRPDAKDKTDFTLDELLEKSFYFVRFQTYWENLSDTPVEKDMPKDLPKIRGFIGGLAITFLNLVMNAYQAMTDAGLTRTSQRLIKISARTLKDEPDFVEIRLSNKGPLIPENDLERIFEAGYTTKKKGSGMGLNICKAIVEHYNGGTIYARNISGFGPEFVIKLPIAKEGDQK